jgi:energy-coupling factor transporter ATP-binding protein EcfA2
VSRYADRVVVMDKGKIALDGKPREVYNEQARLIGIGLPKVTMLFHLLQTEGLHVNNPITVEEASAEIRKLIQ